MTPLGPGLPSLVTMLFKCPIRGIMPIMNRPLVGIYKDEEHYEVLLKGKEKMTKTKVLPEIMFLFQ